MSKPRVIILRAPGINCDQETCRAWELAGADYDLVHLDRLIENPNQLDRYDILTLPGGFSFGDDVSAGKIFANRMLHYLADQLREFVSRDRLVLGICNGFQILVKTGLLAANSQGDPCTLTLNDCGQFVCRWITVGAQNDNCLFLEKGRKYFLPIAHAEGKFMVSDPARFENNRIALQYCDDTRRVGADNPNGSFLDIAALTDATGRVLGMMPHPERFVDRLQHPFWTACDSDLKVDGLEIFRAAVAQFS